MGEAKIFLIPCETNILHSVIRIEVADSGLKPRDGIFSNRQQLDDYGLRTAWNLTLPRHIYIPSVHPYRRQL